MGKGDNTATQKSSGNSTQTTSWNIPQNVQNAWNQALAMAGNAAGQPFTPYGGVPVAPFAPDSLEGMQRIRGIADTPNPLQDQLYSSASNLLSTQNGGLPTQQQIEVGMNPYTQNVTNVGLENLQEQYDVMRQQLYGNKALAGSFGGARHGIQEAELQKGFLRNAMELTYGGQQDAYNQSVDNWFRGQGQQTNALNSAAGINNMVRTNQLQDAQNLMNIGGMYQGQAQGALDFGVGEFGRGVQYPFDTANFFSNIAYGYPWQSSDSTTTGSWDQTQTTTTPGPSPFEQILGAGMGIASMFNPMMGLANMGMKALSGVGGNTPNFVLPQGQVAYGGPGFADGGPLERYASGGRKDRPMLRPEDLDEEELGILERILQAIGDAYAPGMLGAPRGPGMRYYSDPDAGKVGLPGSNNDIEADSTSYPRRAGGGPLERFSLGGAPVSYGRNLSGSSGTDPSPQAWNNAALGTFGLLAPPGVGAAVNGLNQLSTNQFSNVPVTTTGPLDSYVQSALTSGGVINPANLTTRSAGGINYSGTGRIGEMNRRKYAKRADGGDIDWQEFAVNRTGGPYQGARPQEYALAYGDNGVMFRDPYQQKRYDAYMMMNDGTPGNYRQSGFARGDRALTPDEINFFNQVRLAGMTGGGGSPLEAAAAGAMPTDAGGGAGGGAGAPGGDPNGWIDAVFGGQENLDYFMNAFGNENPGGFGIPEGSFGHNTPLGTVAYNPYINQLYGTSPYAEEHMGDIYAPGGWNDMQAQRRDWMSEFLAGIPSQGGGQGQEQGETPNLPGLGGQRWRDRVQARQERRGGSGRGFADRFGWNRRALANGGAIDWGNPPMEMYSGSAQNSGFSGDAMGNLTANPVQYAQTRGNRGMPIAYGHMGPLQRFMQGQGGFGEQQPMQDYQYTTPDGQMTPQERTDALRAANPNWNPGAPQTRPGMPPPGSAPMPDPWGTVGMFDNKYGTWADAFGGNNPAMPDGFSGTQADWDNYLNTHGQYSHYTGVGPAVVGWEPPKAPYHDYLSGFMPEGYQDQAHLDAMNSIKKSSELMQSRLPGIFSETSGTTPPPQNNVPTPQFPVRNPQQPVNASPIERGIGRQQGGFGNFGWQGMNMNFGQDQLGGMFGKGQGRGQGFGGPSRFDKGGRVAKYSFGGAEGDEGVGGTPAVQFSSNAAAPSGPQAVGQQGGWNMPMDTGVTQNMGPLAGAAYTASEIPGAVGRHVVARAEPYIRGVQGVWRGIQDALSPLDDLYGASQALSGPMPHPAREEQAPQEPTSPIEDVLGGTEDLLGGSTNLLPGSGNPLEEAAAAILENPKDPTNVQKDEGSQKRQGLISFLEDALMNNTLLHAGILMATEGAGPSMEYLGQANEREYQREQDIREGKIDERAYQENMRRWEAEQALRQQIADDTKRRYEQEAVAERIGNVRALRTEADDRFELALERPGERTLPFVWYVMRNYGEMAPAILQDYGVDAAWLEEIATQGLPPQQFAARVSQEIQRAIDAGEINYDNINGTQ